MLLYRTRKRIKYTVGIVAFVVLGLGLLIELANSPDRSGSKLPILLERTVGSWVRGWSKGIYEEYFSTPAIGRYATRDHRSFYSFLEFITFDDRRSDRKELEHAFGQAVIQSVRGKTARLDELTRLVEVQSIIGDKTAREIETRASSRFNLDYLLGEVRFLENFSLVRFPSKTRGKKKGKGKKAKKKGKGKNQKRKWLGDDAKLTYEFGDRLEISKRFYSILEESPGKIIAHTDGLVYYSRPVKDFDDKNTIGLLIAVFRPGGFVDLSAFHLPALGIHYHLGSHTSRDKTTLVYKGPGHLKNETKNLLPDDPGVFSLAHPEHGALDYLFFENYHNYGFKLKSFYEVRTFGFFFFRIGGFLFLLLLLVFSYRFFKLLQRYWHDNPIQLPTGNGPLLENLRQSVANTDQTLELTNKTLDALAESLKNPAPVDVNIGSSFRAIFENLEKVVQNQNYLFNKLEGKAPSLDTLKEDYYALESGSGSAAPSVPETAETVVESGEDEEEFLVIPEQASYNVEVELEDEFDEWGGPAFKLNADGAPVPVTADYPAKAPAKAVPAESKPASEEVQLEETGDTIVLTDYRAESEGLIQVPETPNEPEVFVEPPDSQPEPPVLFDDPDQAAGESEVTEAEPTGDAPSGDAPPEENWDDLELEDPELELIPDEEDEGAPVASHDAEPETGGEKPAAETDEALAEDTQSGDNSILPELEEPGPVAAELSPQAKTEVEQSIEAMPLILDVDDDDENFSVEHREPDEPPPAELPEQPGFEKIAEDSPGKAEPVVENLVQNEEPELPIESDPDVEVEMIADEPPAGEATKDETDDGLATGVDDTSVFVTGENDDPLEFYDSSWENAPEDESENKPADDSLAETPLATNGNGASRPPRLFDTLLYPDPQAKVATAEIQPLSEEENGIELDVIPEEDEMIPPVADASSEPYQDFRARFMDIGASEEDADYAIFEENLDTRGVDFKGTEVHPERIMDAELVKK